MSVNADKGSIRRGRQIVDRPVGADAGNLIPSRVDRPDLAGKAHLLALLDDSASLYAAKDGDGFRAEQAFEAVHGVAFPFSSHNEKTAAAIIHPLPAARPAK